MLKLLLPFLAPIITGVIDGYKAKLAAENTADKIAADLAAKDLELQGRERELNVRQNIADEGRWWTAAPRAIVCWSIALFIAKSVVWDKMFGFGTTPELRGFVADVGSAVIVMWFGGRTIEKVARIWRAR
jgi:hypothetical protein